jgi:hypothetical protein
MEISLVRVEERKKYVHEMNTLRQTLEEEYAKKILALEAKDHACQMDYMEQKKVERLCHDIT